MILPIYVYGQPVLRKIGKEIDMNHKDLKNLINDMFETMYKSDGVGLAAPQIGQSIKLFVIDGTPMAKDDPSLTDFKKVFINPIILEESGDDCIYNEGCLSLPGIREDIVRKSIIKIKYLDENFNPHEEIFDGMKARIIQHEYDHTNGILFIDRISPLRKKLLKRRLNDIINGKVDISYKIKIAK